MNTPPKTRIGAPPKFVVVVYWSGIAFAIACFVVNLLISAIRGVTAQSASLAVLLLGIGVTTLCVILWIGHVTGIRQIGKASMAIWGTLIASVLATSAGTYKTLLTPQAIHVRIEKFVLFDESQVEDNKGQLSFKELKVKPNYDYQAITANDGNKDVTVAFGVLVSGFQRDISGKFSIAGEVTLSSTDGELFDKGDLPQATDDDYIKNRPLIKQVGPKQIEQIMGSVDGKVLYIQVLRKFKQPVLDSGTKNLQVTIKDLNSSSFAEASQRVVFR